MPVGDEGTWTRPRQDQCQRRSYCARTSVGREWHTFAHHADERIAPPQGTLRPVDRLYRRWSGHRRDHREPAALAINMVRTIAGIIVGYLIFAVPSYLLFRLTHVDPHAPASSVFEAIAILYGIVFALLGGYLGTAIGQKFWVAF